MQACYMVLIILLIAPGSPSKTTDLDQIAALISSGIFVFIFSIGDLADRDWEQISFVSCVVAGLLGCVGATLIEWLEQIYRALWFDAVVEWIRGLSSGRNVA
jgi:hypothetical protein